MNAAKTTSEQGFRDAGGHAVFCEGEIGAAHVLAHRLFDQGRIGLGRRVLGQWLETHEGSGSDWIHLHFHVALFELALGDWDAAYARFNERILPTAAATEDALTDAPALLWRLQLAAPRRVELPWQALRRTALARLQRPCDPFVELHSLLALAGAGDIENIDRWVQQKPLCDDAVPECVLRRLVIALRSYATRTYRRAAEALESLLPLLPTLGGSLVQQELFAELTRSSSRLALARDGGRG